MASIWKHPQCNNYFARYRDKDGRWRNASTGCTSRTEARKIADEYEAAGKARRSAIQVRRVLSRLHAEITGEVLPSSSLRAFVAAWLNEKKATAQSTQVYYRGCTTKFLDHLGPVADDEITAVSKEHVLSFRNALLERLTEKSANHDLKVVKMVFRAAKRDGYIVDDPSEFVATVKTKGTVKRRRPFTIKEVRAVLSVANDEWRSMILFGLYTGQRLSDIARMTWANLDLTRSQVRLVTSKTGAALVIPMAKPLKKHVKALPTPDARPDEAPLHPKACALLERHGGSGMLSNHFADLLSLAGLREKTPHRVSTGQGRDGRHATGNLSFHCLRHTAVSLLKEAGVPPAVVQALIGHESSQISELYTTIGEDALAKAASAFPSVSPNARKGHVTAKQSL